MHRTAAVKNQTQTEKGYETAASLEMQHVWVLGILPARTNPRFGYNARRHSCLLYCVPCAHSISCRSAAAQTAQTCGLWWLLCGRPEVVPTWGPGLQASSRLFSRAAVLFLSLPWSVSQDKEQVFLLYVPWNVVGTDYFCVMYK